MRKHDCMVWLTIIAFAVTLGFFVACTKEAFKETPGTPKFKKAPAAVPSAEVPAAKGKEAVKAKEAAKAEKEKKATKITEEEAAALREQALREAEEKRKIREQEEKARLEEQAKLREQERLALEKKKEEERREFEAKPIYFAFDSAVLSEEAKAVLRSKAQYLTEHPDAHVIIEGHCDERGSVEYNLALGQRRAESAQRYLVMLGVDPSRIRTISYGKERPADPRHNEEAWSKNRRCEFILE